jgi:hypothetical protein
MAKQQEKQKKITNAVVRMYRMGTGDCFIIKFFAGKVNTFTMMIDCGTWQGTKKEIATYVNDLKVYTGNKIDLLVVTHEHKDHVYGFDACKELFTNNFEIKKIWMAWTENDNPASAGDSLDDKVKDWKREHGQRKKALNIAAEQFTTLFATEEKKQEAQNSPRGMAAFQLNYANSLNQFAELQFSARGADYVGSLEGMRIAKEELKPVEGITYYHPGQIIENIENAEGIRFYVLGPPTSIDSIKTESGPVGETFSHSHNNSKTDNDAFATALLNLGASQLPASVLPFDESYIMENQQELYSNPDEAWRTIEHDWLNSAGALALRMNSATNNLSLALAIEFIDTGRVMLFPGDAEYGSWASWHDINWPTKGKDGKTHLTEDLLNRTVFYKVAHHLSHNGTAKKRGVEMMKDKALIAMATLDYDRISDGWTGTMPNRDLVSDLLTRTKGRLIIMNENGLFTDQTTKKKTLHEKIEEVRSQLMSPAEQKNFKNSMEKDEQELYIQISIPA